MNPLSLIPEKVRLAIYAIYALGVPVLAYTESRGWTGQAEKDLWLGLGIAIGIAAASNVSVGSKLPNATAVPVLVSEVHEYIPQHAAVEDERDHFVEDIPEATLPEDVGQRGTP